MRSQYQWEYIFVLQIAEPDAISHPRWLTKSNILLQLYACQESPSENLGRIVKFILNIYAASWLHINTYPTCQKGAKNIFFMILLYQKLNKNDQTVIAQILQNYSYLCHPKNILLTSIGDEDENIRKFSCNKIILTRNTHSSNRMRCFDKSTITVTITPELYMNMGDLGKCDFVYYGIKV